MSFWEVLWSVFLIFLFVAYLLLLFTILSDLFRDPDMRGLVKVLWVICLLFLPFVTALLYVLVHGRAMAERSADRQLRARYAREDYIRDVARVDAASQIAAAKQLLDQGAITRSEFEQIKHTALP
ncbi:SHOCT domain-containing protein [Nocardia crassostreae]|uniref:SHOCT domain-containing protein n=1 Tax=Nocardia crassostreae TaxID=53428 RepID=UPI0008358D13|nr:SHOCT domain-containing protein [Nocardia crassostreae]